jgi:hypothetical protein
MTTEEWSHAYKLAARTFYGPENMIATLTRYEDAAARWRLVKAFLWYRWAYVVEQSHPMIAGFYRHRPFTERRPGYSHNSRLRHLAGEAWRHLRYLGVMVREYYVFQHVILESEFRITQGQMSDRVGRGMKDLSGRVRTLNDWRRRTFHSPMRRDWLNDFWIRYGQQKWRLLSPTGAWWHLKLPPFLIAEFVYSLRFAAMFRKGMRIRSY